MRRVTACPACSSTERRALMHVVSRVVRAEDQLVYCYCDRCGLVYAQDVIDTRAECDGTYTDPYRRLSDEQILRDSTVFRLRKNRYRKAWLDKQLAALGKTYPAGKQALEIGAKDGSFLWLLKQDGWQVAGIDPNRRYGAWARQHYGVDIQDGYFQPGSVSGTPYDLVALFCVFEHIDNPGAFLGAVRSALREGGLLYLETDNLAYLQQRQLIPMHPILYSRQTLTQVLARHGFRILAMTENAPGGAMVFDQLAVLAEVAEGPAPLTCQPAEDFATAKRMLERALSDDFPSPTPTGTNRLFRAVSRVLGERLASLLKAGYVSVRGMGNRRRLATRESADGQPTSRRFPEPIRDAFLQGSLTASHLEELAKLDDECVQLKILARIRAYRLSAEATRQLVERERAHDCHGIEQAIVS